jgi:hypothetical protein
VGGEKDTNASEIDGRALAGAECVWGIVVATENDDIGGRILRIDRAIDIAGGFGTGEAVDELKVEEIFENEDAGSVNVENDRELGEIQPKQN